MSQITQLHEKEADPASLSSKALWFRVDLEWKGQRFTIRPAEARDLETLRIWKNNHRDYFFHKDEISTEQQIAWFASFSTRIDQNLFVLESNAELSEGLYGCVGYRQTASGCVELFNLIRGEQAASGQGLMKAFFDVTVLELKRLGQREIALKVLKSNPHATEWYLRQGFRQVQSDDQSWHLSLQLG